MWNDTESEITKWLLFAIIIVIFIRVSQFARRYEMSNVHEYLTRRYPEIHLQVQRKNEDDEVYYLVNTQTPYALSFIVKKNIDGKWVDNYTAQFFCYLAEQCGIKTRLDTEWDSVLTVSNISLYYSDYGSIDDLAVRIDKLAELCQKEINTISLGIPSITVRPENNIEAYFPGYDLKANMALTGGIQLDLTDLAARIKYNYIANVYNYTLAPENTDIPESDFRQFEKNFSGIAIIDENGRREIYPLVCIRDGQYTQYIDFGGAYQILKNEGTIVEENLNQFTIVIDEIKVSFSVEFTVTGPVYKWEYDSENMIGDSYEEGIPVTEIEKLIGKRLEEEDMDE